MEKKDKIYLGTGIAIVLILALFFGKSIIGKETETTLRTEKEVTSAEEIPKTTVEEIKFICVEIDGAVERPDIYRIPEVFLIYDLINMAGGLKSDADIKKINRSQKLRDEDKIYIPSVFEDNILKNSENFISTTQICIKISGEINLEGNYIVKRGITVKELVFLAGGLTNQADYEAFYKIKDCIIKENSVLYIPKINSSSTQNPENEAALININTASLEELMKLSGVGSVSAQNIIDYRIANGNFFKIEDILNVKGIGSATFEKIKNFITI